MQTVDDEEECEELLNSNSLSQVPIEIFPIPARDVLNFRGLNSPVEVSVYDINGRLLSIHDNVQSLMDVNTLQPGLYFLSIKQGTRTFTKKITKE